MSHDRAERTHASVDWRQILRIKEGTRGLVEVKIVVIPDDVALDVWKHDYSNTIGSLEKKP